MAADAVSVSDVLALVALASVLAALGQLIRSVAELADPDNLPFELRPFLVGVVIAGVVGAAAGAVGAVTFVGTSIGAGEVAGLIAIGYVGTDLVEQFLKRACPALTSPGSFGWPVADREADGVWEPSRRN